MLINSSVSYAETLASFESKRIPCIISTTSFKYSPVRTTITASKQLVPLAICDFALSDKEGFENYSRVCIRQRRKIRKEALRLVWKELDAACRNPIMWLWNNNIPPPTR